MGWKRNWDESVCYRFTAPEIDVLEAATNELHRLCRVAVQQVIDRRLFANFGIAECYVLLNRHPRR